MEHAHDGPKAAEKAQDLPARRNSGQPKSPGAHALLNLQRAAGNQAVAKLLTASGRGPQRQPRPVDPSSPDGLPPLNVQRDFASELRTLLGGSHVNDSDRQLAEFVVGTMKEGSPGSGKTELGSKGKTTSSVSTTKKGGLQSLEDIDTRRKALVERRRQLGLDGKLTGAERERLERTRNLDRLEEETNLAQSEKELNIRPKKGQTLEAREREVERAKKRADLAEKEKALNLSPEEREQEDQLRDREERLKETERQEELRQEKRRAATAAKKLNPAGSGGSKKGGRKSMGELLSGRRF